MSVLPLCALLYSIVAVFNNNFVFKEQSLAHETIEVCETNVKDEHSPPVFLSLCLHLQNPVKKKFINSEIVVLVYVSTSFVST